MRVRVLVLTLASALLASVSLGEKPILQPASGANWVLHFQGDATKYIEVRGLVLDANVARPDIAC